MAKKTSKKTKKPSKADVLENIHTALADTLLTRVRSGAATAADLNVARAFLKDNGVEGNLDNNQPLRELAAELPFAPTGTETR